MYAIENKFSTSQAIFSIFSLSLFSFRPQILLQDNIYKWLKRVIQWTHNPALRGQNKCFVLIIYGNEGSTQKKYCFIISTIFVVSFLSRIGKSQHIFSVYFLERHCFVHFCMFYQFVIVFIYSTEYVCVYLLTHLIIHLSTRLIHNSMYSFVYLLDYFSSYIFVWLFWCFCFHDDHMLLWILNVPSVWPLNNSMSCIDGCPSFKKNKRIVIYRIQENKRI